MTWIEIVATIFGLLCVWLTVRRNIWCWPTGLVMVLLYAVIFWNAKLYSDMLLQFVYVAMQVYGWRAWLKGGPDDTPLLVSRLPASQRARWLAVGVVGAGALGGSMHAFTDASFPYLDAVATVGSLIAQWLMGRKVLESWLFWIFVDVVYIGLFLAKELYPTAILYAIFLVMATLGWFEWRTAWKERATA